MSIHQCALNDSVILLCSHRTTHKNDDGVQYVLKVRSDGTRSGAARHATSRFVAISRAHISGILFLFSEFVVQYMIAVLQMTLKSCTMPLNVAAMQF